MKHRETQKTLRQLSSYMNLSYNLHKDIRFRSYNVKTVHYGTKKLSCLGPKIWNLVPPEIKDSETLEISLKTIIK